MSSLIDPDPSETAVKKVDELYPHLPAPAARQAAQWITLLEDVDARNVPVSQTADASFQELTAMAQRYTQEELAGRHREWIAARAPILRGLMGLLDLYPAPIFMVRR